MDSIVTGGRRSGRTTAQLSAAPTDAFFVVANEPCLAYTKSLAKKLGRNDLQIVTVRYFLSSDRWRGIDANKIAFDHYASESMPPDALRAAMEILWKKTRPSTQYPHPGTASPAEP